MKQKTKNGKPRGASFADVLAHKRQMRAAVEKAAADKMVEVRSEIAVQRILWLAVASVADAYGFGAKRLDLFFRALDENTREYQRMAEENDEDYANEKLRLKAERVTGTQIRYLYEWEAAQAAAGPGDDAGTGWAQLPDQTKGGS